MHRFHGVASLTLIALAISTAVVFLFLKSAAGGLAYLMLVLTSSTAVLMAYCAKCTARDRHCSHIFPGKLARLLPQRPAGPYSPMELAATAAALAVLFFFPQYWLWQNKWVLLVFWALTAAALAQILLRVCPNCRNLNCLMCRDNDR